MLVRGVPLWHGLCLSLWAQGERLHLSPRGSPALVSTATVLFWPILGWQARFRAGGKTTLQPFKGSAEAAYFSLCVCQGPPPVYIGHVGFSERAAGGEAKEGWGSLKRQIQQCEPVKWGRQSCVCHWGICTHGVDQDASGQRWGLILQWNLILAARCAPYRDNIASGFIYICEGMHSKSTAILQSKINYVVNLSKLVNNFERRHLSVLGTPPKLQKTKKGCHYTNTIPLLYRQSEESNVKQHLLHHPKWLPISCDVSQLCSIKCSTFPSITIL